MRRYVLVSGLCAGLMLAMAGPASAQVSLTPDTADFGKVRVGTQSAPTVFTLTNGPIAGSYTTDPNVSRGDEDVFKIVSETCPSELPNNSSCTISVVFAPISVASGQGGLLYVERSSDLDRISALMRGEGIPASSGKGKGKGKKCKKKGKKGAAAAKKKGCKKKKK
jgi:hypothetical protein